MKPFKLKSSWLWLPSLAVAVVTAQNTHARGSEGERRNSILLNGAWDYCIGTGDEGAETPAGQRGLSWKAVTLPGAFVQWNQEVANQTRFLWARRTFTVSPEQASSLAVLRWNRIANGAIAFINGRGVGDNEPTGPYQVMLPAGALKSGENQIVLKIRGAAGVRRSRSGNPLIPAGFGVGMPEVTDDVWIDFADHAYLKWVLAMPDLVGKSVKFRVTPVGPEALNDLALVADVRSWPDGELMGEGRASARLVPDPYPLGGEHFTIEVPMPDCRPWTYEDRVLYNARVEIRQGERMLDEVTFRFGMREIGVKDRNYRLNGRNLWLRGSNLVFEWDWGDTITGHELDYLVTEAREMSMNSFRTHTRPPPRLWADIGDEHGTMFLAEFPVLFNYQDYQFTPDEWEIWHRNCLLDAAGWMTRLWNHPAVILWVLSNESRDDNAWEEGPFQGFVNTLDPTRPTMRTGTTGTRDNLDIHACGNVTDTDEGRLLGNIQYWFPDAGERTTTCSEYMNYFGHPHTQWSGIDDPMANALAVAQIGAEHTEATRRARLDGIWPYMYAGWTRTRLAARVRERGEGSAVWKANFAAPESAAWHSSLSPVLASLDLFDPDYRTNQEVTTALHLINDSWHEANIRVDLLLTQENPEWIPEAPCLDQPVRQWSFEFTLGADSIRQVPVTWQLPAQEGNYWLTARTTGLPGRPVLSQRFVRAVAVPVVSEATRQRTFVVLGGNGAARAFFTAHNLRISERLEGLSPSIHTVVVWNASRLTVEEKRHAGDLCKFAGRGGQIVVLATPSWDWTDLCRVEIKHDPRFSRVFRRKPAQGNWLGDIDGQWLVRWNGLPGTVATGSLEGTVLNRAEKILWAREPSTTVMARVPAASGDGFVLFSQLNLQERLDRSQPNHDPVAERVLLELLKVTKQ